MNAPETVSDAARPAPTLSAPESVAAQGLEQVVLVLQGGGALGAYQGGVYEALDAAGIAPTWLIGTSIGAINAAIIAGNRPGQRLARLQEFWARVRHAGASSWAALVPGWGQQLANGLTFMQGVSGFFRPNPVAHLALGPLAYLAPALTPTTAGYYSIAPLASTLADLIDLDVLNERAVRLTVGAANVRTAEMAYFDSRDRPLDVRHILASGALPPAFPAVDIDGELYWDGGVISNTPVEVVFDDNPRRNSLVFAVHMWRPCGPDPDTMIRVMSRHKDLQYMSRAATHIARQKQIHRLRHVVAELVDMLPPEALESPEARELAAFACTTRMHVVRLVAPPLAGEDHSKDIDFSADGIRQRWEAGYADTMRVIGQQPWMQEADPLEGFILHETDAGQVMADG